jgi:NADH-quinone oxidoreductase subunit J
VLELFIAVLGSGLKALGTRGAPVPVGFGSPGQIGQALLTNFLAPFEIASYLLLIAAVGAVVLARRRGGIGDDDDDGIGVPTISAMDLFRPMEPGAHGTMAEGAGRIRPATPAPAPAPAEQEPVA